MSIHKGKQGELTKKKPKKKYKKKNMKKHKNKC